MLDLDAAHGQLEEVWRNGWYPNSTVSSGVLLKTMDALIAELRKLREENASLKAFADDVVDSFDCDCHEDYYKPGEKCFYCKAKEALPKSPEVKP